MTPLPKVSRGRWSAHRFWVTNGFPNLTLLSSRILERPVFTPSRCHSIDWPVSLDTPQSFVDPGDGEPAVVDIPLTVGGRGADSQALTLIGFADAIGLAAKLDSATPIRRASFTI